MKFNRNLLLQYLQERKKEEKVVRKKSQRIKDIKSNLKKYQLKTTPISEKDLERWDKETKGKKNKPIKIAERKISRFINEAAEEKLAQEQKKIKSNFQKQLISDYQDAAQDEELNKELKREIYELNFSPSRGKEIRDIHPGLVVSNDIQNEYGHYIIVAPLTSTLKRERLFEKIIAPSLENGLEKKIGGLLLVLFKNKGQLILDNTPEFLDYCAKSNGLVFFGPIGSGKTAILAMLANELPGENKYATFP
ncbi:12844_t:CDS:2, partial [Cetraspora pellucida]